VLLARLGGVTGPEELHGFPTVAMSAVRRLLDFLGDHMVGERLVMPPAQPA
jgi:hypothetical protein